MTNTQRFILIHSVLALMLLSRSVHAAPACGDLFTDKNKPAAHEHVKATEFDDKLTKLVRSNSPQYWAWSKQFGLDYLPSEVLKFNGWVVGDPHNKNFGILKYNGKVRWNLVDMDDPGRGPMILDFVKFLAATKSVSSWEKIKAKDIWRAYISGLKGEKNGDVPDIVQDLLEMTPAEFRELEIKKAQKFSASDKLINDGERSSKIEDAKLEKFILDAFQKALPDVKVLDVGGREKERGGSVDALRFVALVKGKDGRNTLVEFKENLGTAMEKYQPQKETFEDALEFFMQSKNGQDAFYQSVDLIIDGQNHNFLLRPKQLYFYDYANKAKTKSQFNEFEALTMYNAWFIGRMHGSQKNGKDYAKLLEKDDEGPIFNGVKDMMWSYLKYLEGFLPE